MRQLIKKDGNSYVTLLKQLEGESEYLLFERNERQMSGKQVEEMIEAFQTSGNSSIWGIEKDGQLVAHLTCIGGHARRNAHTAKLVAGVLKKYQARGFAYQLLEQVKEWARNQDLHRLELTVMTHNEKAVNLYQKAGFHIEGIKKDNLLVQNKWVDEYIMALLLD